MKAPLCWRGSIVNGFGETLRTPCVLEEVIVKKMLPLFLVVLALVAAAPASAAPIPSKTAANQSLDARAADLALVRAAVSNEQVAQALAQQGFTKDEVNTRIAQLSSADLHSLAQNVNQIEAAGLTKQQWFWVGAGVAALVIILLLTV